MSTYRKITILFADEELAMAYTDEALAQTVLERCEEWQQKELEIGSDYVVEAITASEYRDKLQAHKDAHPLDPSYANVRDYALKTVFLHEYPLINQRKRKKMKKMQKVIDAFTIVNYSCAAAGQQPNTPI